MEYILFIIVIHVCVVIHDTGAIAHPADGADVCDGEENL